MEIIQCFLPFIAIAMILSMAVGLGLLIDPKGTIAFLLRVKSDWHDILNGDE